MSNTSTLASNGNQTHTDETYELQLTMTGVTPLLVKNPERLANPTDPAARKLNALTQKRGKTDEDYAEIAGIEFALSLYYADDIGPYMPTRNIVAMLAESGGHYKIGAPIKRGHYIIGDGRNPIRYEGPRTIPGMREAGYAFTRPVAMNNSGKKKTVLRTHPRFVDWTIVCEIGFDSQEVSRDQLDLALARCARIGAIGDMRPNYGRFTLEVEG